jgi:hypothetical protein
VHGRAIKDLDIPDNFDLLAMIASGKRGTKENLPPNPFLALANKEQMRYATVVISIYFYSRVVVGKSDEFAFVS